MLIKIKKEVEESIEVKIPFATKQPHLNWYYIVEEDFVLTVSDDIILKRQRGKDSYGEAIDEALKYSPVSIDEAYNKMEEVLSTFERVIA